MPPIARALQACPRRTSARVTSDMANLNLRTFADANGYSGAGDFTLTINSGVEVYSASAATPAIVTGTFPAGVTVAVVNNGTVSGAAGNGGAGYIVAAAQPTAGQAGGTALDATGAAAFTLSVDNTNGVLRGGGGGGCGGGGGPDGAGGYFAGGGGGGGRGRSPGAAGAGGGVDSNGRGASNGVAGSTTAAGAGGAASSDDDTYGVGYAGGDGGTWGDAGGTPTGTPTGDVNFDGPQSAAAAGHAVTGNANITWVATGTRIGTVA